MKGVGRQIGLGFAMVIACVVLLGIVAMYESASMNAAVQRIVDAGPVRHDADDLLTNAAASQAAVAEYIATADTTTIAKIEPLRQATEHDFAEIAAHAAGNTALLAAIDEAKRRGTLLQNFRQHQIDLVAGENQHTALLTLAGGESAMQSGYQDAIDAIVAIVGKTVDANAAAVERAKVTSWIVVIVSAAALQAVFERSTRRSGRSFATTSPHSWTRSGRLPPAICASRMPSKT